MSELDYGQLAIKVMKGFQKGDLNPKKIGIVGAEFQKLYRRMKKDKFEGSVAFYVCKVLYEKKIAEYAKIANQKKQRISIGEKTFDVNFDIATIPKSEAFCVNLWALSLVDNGNNTKNLDQFYIAFNIIKSIFEFEVFKNTKH